MAGSGAQAGASPTSGGGGGGSATPGGSNTQVQFNDAGSFAGSAKMVFDKTTGNLTLTTGTTYVKGGGLFVGGATGTLNTGEDGIYLGYSGGASSITSILPNNSFAPLTITGSRYQFDTRNTAQFRLGFATTADSLADALIATSATTQKALVLQAKAGQTANIFETQASTGGILLSVPQASAVFGSYGFTTSTGNFITNSGGFQSASGGGTYNTAYAPAFGWFVRSDNVFGWGSASPYTAVDTGLSRTAAATVAVGNGTAGDYSGTLKVSSIVRPSGANLNITSGAGDSVQISASGGTIFAVSNGVLAAAGMQLGTYQGALTKIYAGNAGLLISDTTGSVPDVNVSRTAAGTLGFGNGTAGNATGTIQYAKSLVGTATTADALADNLFATSATTQKALVLQGKAGQTANLQEWQRASDGLAYAAMSSGGALHAQEFDAGADLATAVSMSAFGFALNNATYIYFSTGTNPNTSQFTNMHSTAQGIVAINNASISGEGTGTLKITNVNGPGTTTALTESSDTGFATLTYAANKRVVVDLLCMVEAADATDGQSMSYRVRVNSVRKATGNTVSTVGVIDASAPAAAVTAGGSTLTCTFTVTEGASAATVNANCVSSLTQTTLNISFLSESVGPVTVAKL